ncbi:hypothetical protein SK128_005548 [Halocaridina rubra]|uniref:Uncharacterized protein n=1 Tax=Halocaridina rubra TaxID=373956 RepID=A0AAN8XGK1_HALRR
MSEGINITQTETPSTSQEFVLNFLSTVCTGVTGSTRSGAEEEVNIEEFLVQLKRWFNRPKPQSPFNLFCDRANQWLGTSGANITGISGNGDNLPTVFIDFLTNICDNTRKLPEQEENENADKSERWFFRPPFSFSNSCFGQFCEETNNWLETTSKNS